MKDTTNMKYFIPVPDCFHPPYHPSIYLPIHPSTYLSIYLSIHPSYLPINPSTHPSIQLFLLFWSKEHSV